MESLREPAMSFNELGELFRMEHKSKMLTEVGGDLYQNIAELLRYLKKRYEQQLSADPENPKTDRANQERILGTQRAKAIVDMRMEKICKMALRGAMGSVNPIDKLTREEKEYYETILKHSVSHRKIIDRLSGNIRYRNTEIVPDTSEEKEELPPAFHVPETDDPPLEDEPPATVSVPKTLPDTIPDDWGESNDDVPLEPIEEIMQSMPEAPVREERPFVPPIDDVVSEDEEFDGEIPEDDLDRMMADDMPVRAPAEKKTVPAGREEPKRDDLVLLRILVDVPMPIAGPDGQQYILKKENVVRMPAMLAQMLVGNKMAAELHPSP